LLSYVNGKLFGDPDAGAMVHGFDRLIAHAAKTRALSAGSIVGGGTVASSERARGTSCITERRVLEQLDTGSAVTPYLHYGDKVRLEILDDRGQSIFGAIEQTVARVIECSSHFIHRLIVLRLRADFISNRRRAISSSD
jgi:fumarylacetoacetate (FAA) hydrolase